MKKTRWALLLLSLFTGPLFGKNPVLLVPGWGPPVFTDMKRLKSFFEADGYSRHDLHHIRYPYKGSLEKIRQVLIPQFKRVLALYPPGTRFDVVTHSLGHFVAMESLLEGGMGDSVEHYVGLAGIGHGQYDLPPGCGVASCSAFEPLTPFPSPYVKSLLAKHADTFGGWKKCSLYSRNDSVLGNPFFASHFPGGTNVEVSGYRHNDFLFRRDLYQLMQNRCGLNRADQ